MNCSPPPSPLPDSNPFATRWVRPGAMAYRFAPGVDGGQLLARLQQHGWWGQIVGPHGSGKSTLLHTLLPLLQQAGRRVEHVTLRQGQRRLGLAGSSSRTWDAHTQIVVDGYEQLGWWSRLGLKRACRRQRAGLLVTSHQPVGLPRLFQTCVSLETAQQLVAQLLPADCRSIGPDEVARCYARHQGNLRDVLFALYDLFEQRRGAGP